MFPKNVIIVWIELYVAFVVSIVSQNLRLL
jgi:hypothetical protein